MSKPKSSSSRNRHQDQLHTEKYPSILFQNLVSLPFETLELIILKLSECKGGLQSILSLRVASSITKEWIDNKLSGYMKQKVFNNTQINVPMTEKNLTKFLSAPPPLPVKSLRLSKPDRNASNSIVDDEDFDFLVVSNKPCLIWEQFVDHWSTRLHSVEIDDLTRNPAPEKYEILFSRCLFIVIIHTSISTDNILHNRSSLLKEFVLRYTDKLSRDEVQTEEIFEQILLAKNNLEVLEVPIRTPRDVRSITKFIEATNQDSNIRISLNLHLHFLKIIELNEDERAFYRFVCAVASSKSNIQVALLGPTPILHLDKHVGSQVTKKFCEKITRMSYFIAMMENNGHPRLREFVNLNRIDVLIVEVLAPDAHESLQWVGVWNNTSLSFIRSLPDWLTCLELQEPNWKNVQKVNNFFLAVDKHFCVLRSLKLKFASVVNKQAIETSHDVYANSFSRLRYLDIDLSFTYEDTAKCSRYILKNILQLNLSLESLKLSQCRRGVVFPMVLHSDCTKLITEGSLSHSLVHISFGEHPSKRIRFQNKNDERKLIKMTNNNMRKHKQSHVTTHTRCYCFDGRQ